MWNSILSVYHIGKAVVKKSSFTVMSIFYKHSIQLFFYIFEIFYDNDLLSHTTSLTLEKYKTQCF